jgi:hypothetical protein
MLGYTDIDVYGWDCCFLEGAHHAYGSSEPREVQTLTLRRAPEALPLVSFQTTYVWADEVEQALGHISELRVWGVDVKVHGPGMLRAALDFMDSLEEEDGQASSNS